MSFLFDVVGGGPRASVEYGSVTDLQNPAPWLMDLALGRRTASGERVSEASAMGLSAYFACLRNGAEDVAKLPRELRRKRGDERGNEQVTDHGVARVLRRPNPIMPWSVFAQVMQHRRMGWGNAYAEIIRKDTGDLELWPIQSSRVRPEMKADGRTLVYWIRVGNGSEEPVSPDRILHLRGLGSGIEGYSVLRCASETFGLGLAAQRHAAAFFGEGLAKRLVAFAKQTLNADAREQLRKRIEGDREKNPVGSRRMPIVDVEVDVKDLGIPPDEAQFLEQREFGVEEVARWFRMNLSKIQYFKRAQGWSSLDALNTEYVVDFLTPQLKAWEEEMDLKLLMPEEYDSGLRVKFNEKGLLRGDVSTRIAYYSAGYRDGWLSQNDIRDLEDMNPIEDPAADEYRVQAQMTRLEDAGAKPAPALPAPRVDPDEDDEESDARRALSAVRVEAQALVPIIEDRLSRVKAKHEKTGAPDRTAKLVVEVLEPVGLAVDAIAARHPAARVQPANLDEVAASVVAQFSASAPLREIASGVLAAYVCSVEEESHAA